MEDQKHFGDKLVAAMKQAAAELEALQVQAALGKAEAKDKAEELKGKFNDLIQDAKVKVDKGEAKFEKLKGKLEHLEVQLALGKAEAKEVIAEQKKKISNTIHEIEEFFSKL
ncbi:MAG: hypothetical protein IPJ32_19385 [Sphingobacteriaceae bacterium]|nr:hypothetical protein [Sphingobacteriaceae bacterium]